MLTRSKREPGELSAAENLKSLKVAWRTAQKQHADAQAARSRIEAKHTELHRQAVQHDAGHTARLAEAQEALAAAVADDGDIEAARAKVAEVNALAAMRREEAHAISSVLERRRAEAKAAAQAKRAAERDYWMAVSRAELAKVTPSTKAALRRAFVAEKRVNPYLGAWDVYVGWAMDNLPHADFVAIYDQLEREHG